MTSYSPSRIFAKTNIPAPSVSTPITAPPPPHPAEVRLATRAFAIGAPVSASRTRPVNLASGEARALARLHIDVPAFARHELERAHAAAALEDAFHLYVHPLADSVCHVSLRIQRWGLAPDVRNGAAKAALRAESNVRKSIARNCAAP